MHVLITGVGGFAGARVAEACLARDWTVTGVARGAAPRLNGSSRHFRFVRSDIAALSSLPDDLDAVIHAAATRPFVGASVERMMDDNVRGTYRLIDLAVRHRARGFFFFSSTSVFGREHSGVLDDESVPHDLDLYGQTKVLCERRLAEAATDLPSIAIRSPGIIGRGAVGNWVAATLARIWGGETLTIFNPGAAFNNCVHITDLTDLLVSSIEHGIKGHAAAIVCAEGTVTVEDVVTILSRGLRRDTEIRVIEPQRTPFVISCARARRIWGWRPMTVARSLARYADEERRRLGCPSPGDRSTTKQVRGS